MAGRSRPIILIRILPPLHLMRNGLPISVISGPPRAGFISPLFSTFARAALPDGRSVAGRKKIWRFAPCSGRPPCASQEREFCSTRIAAASIAHMITGGCSIGTALFLR